MPKVRFALEEMAGAKGRVERMGEANSKIEKASRTTGNVERTEISATIKNYSESTAQQSLNAHSVARCANAHILNEHAGVRTWAVALYSKLPSAKDFFALIADSGVRPVQNWLHSLTEAGRAERTEQDWQDAVKKAHAAHAFHEHMEDLKASRERYDQATGTAVSSAAGHRQIVEPEEVVPTPLPSVSPAGSIFSNERVVFPTPVELPAAEIITPGLRRLTPTLPRLADTLKLEASSPEELYQPHAIFRDPEHVKFARVNDWSPSDASSKDADCFDLRYFPELDRNGNFDQFNEIITSYSDSLEDYPPMSRSQPCLDIVDRMMQGDGGEMVLFGRWRHRKDAPLSQVKAMIEQELRGPGACSLYGPGGLKIEDHPLVCHFSKRVKKLQEEMAGSYKEPEIPLLSPVLLQGSSASERCAIRSTTPVTFSMSKGGTFQTTGFRMRSASTGSTVDSISPTESSELTTNNEQKDTRRDSGIQGVQPDTSFQNVLDRTGYSSLGNYEILRYYSPDPALKYKAINDETVPDHCRKRAAMVTASYVPDFCRNIPPPAHTRLPSQQGPHARIVRNFVDQGPPQFQKLQAPYNRNTGQSLLGHDLQRLRSRRPWQQAQRDYAAGHQHQAPPTRHMQRRQCPVSALPHQALEAKPTKHVCLDESKNVSYVLPAAHDREVTHVDPEDAENAMFSDDEDTAVDIQKAPNNDNATDPSQPGSLSSKGVRNERSLSNASPGAHRTMPMPRSILKTSNSYVARSASSSAASATAKETAGLNTSTELTPLHATPGTTASSGREYQIKSPALARSITLKLDERLKQMETHLSNKNCISL